MNRVAQAVVSAALLVPLALPAQASTFSSITYVRGAASTHAASSAIGPKEVFTKLHARRTVKSATRLPRALSASPAAANFAFPYAVATDASGDLFVANTDANTIVKVNPALQVLPGSINVGLQLPISVAVDANGNVFAGSLLGGVNVYSTAGGAPQRSIAANTGSPFGIAVDPFDDLYVTTPSGLAVDDPYGASLFPSVSGGTVFSVALEGSTVNAFYNNVEGVGNGSVALRTGHLQYVVGPLVSQSPVGSACTASTCWYDDSVTNQLFMITGGSIAGIPLQYSPGGVAVDPVRNRLFVADPLHNAIQVYNASTLGFELMLN